MQLCPCGQPGVKRIGHFWSCQACLDKDAVVEKLHRAEKRRDSMLPADEWEQRRIDRNQRQLAKYYERKHQKETHRIQA